MPPESPSKPCADCTTNVGLHNIRKRPLCTACFTRYVNSKILKRMESYRIKSSSGISHEKKRLLLPLSGGVSSLVLLSVLAAQLRKQLDTQGRTAYDLVVCCIDATPREGGRDEYGDELPNDPAEASWWSRLVAKFQEEENPAIKFYGMPNITQVFLIDENLITDLVATSPLLTPPSGMKSDTEYYAHIINACSTPTARADIQQIILERSIVALAQQNDCDAVLYGHSDSRLAGLALADVAKGRGGATPARIADGWNEAIGLNVNYPCRDLFKSELELYVQVQEPRLTDLVVSPEEAIVDVEGTATTAAATKKQKAPISVKSMTIDDLLTEYITSQGEKYPSIMANVVRTTGKLQTQETNSPAPKQFCRLCRGTIISRAENDESANRGTVNKELCYGCVRMKQDIKAR
ncbi:Cytoplasmic tRNA 2-thiolation protein 2 [Cyphellophora attinorum]|uniref:Cytoplasmic tRNA 2-thiolation protein 2 n=1 Tax=Cyphellophora attinorum TaxID=1664694 RepID=A0A0N1H6A1_9EURO|nr:Cytoplasmic tRNA 2-thiolation protein 2 [Phialophora attinorum]KPI38182.1 Cytoplasmic tRNA 2-thiolation protein 2 [Phialophora attinorum]